TQDAKIKKLLIRYGAVGYAVYFHCLELIANDVSETNLTFELEHDSEIIADDLHIKGTATQSGQDLVEEIMKYIVELGLFTCSDNRIFCLKLAKRMSLSITSNREFRAKIAQIKDQFNHDEVMTNHDDVMTNHGLVMKPYHTIPYHNNNTNTDNIGRKRFEKPSLADVQAYCAERGNSVDAQKFVDYYESNGWRVGKNPMKDWRAAVRTWERNNQQSNQRVLLKPMLDMEEV
ncbi:MAG TPA: hypothetical protein PLG04_09865, partial [Anaerolineaceae bacterium]|nr:hypothetical protein [Anaerolineaceae bacterium]